MLTPDLRAARRHLYVITGATNPRVAWQWVPDRDKKRQRSSGRIGTLDEYLPDFKRAQNDGCAIYVAVNKTNGTNRRAESMVAATAVFLDLDGTPLPERWPLNPHIITQTSASNPVPKFQCWWRIKPSKDLLAWQALMVILVKRYGADPKCTLTTQVGRCAGFWHQKADPWQVRIITDNADFEDVLSLEEFAAAFGVPDLKAATEAHRKTLRADIRVQEPAQGWDNATDVTRGELWAAQPDSWQPTSNGEVSLWHMACDLRDLGLSPQTCVRIMEQHCPVPLDTWAEGYVEKKVANVYAYAKGDAGAHSATIEDALFDDEPEPFDFSDAPPADFGD